MNMNRKGSAGKPPSQKQHLQTLPCESIEHPYDDDVRMHTGSVCMELVDARKEFLMPASPTFPNDQLSQLSYRGVAEKENRPSLMNREGEQRFMNKQRSFSPGNANLPPTTLHESRLLRGANQRLTERVGQLQVENKHLKMMLTECEHELEKKLRDEFKYLDFFKAANSSDRSHVDIYLELVSLTKLMDEEKKKNAAAQQLMHSKIQDMDRDQKQKEQFYSKSVKEFDTVIDRLNSKYEQQKDEIRLLHEKLSHYQGDAQRRDKEQELAANQLKEYKEEVERTKQLHKRVKDLEEECKSKQVQLKQLQTNFSDVQKEYELVNLENEKNKEANRKLDKKLEVAGKEKEKLGRLLEEERECTATLRQEVEELQNNKAKLNKEVLKIGNDLRSLRNQSELQKQIQTERELGDLENLRSEIEQLKHRIEREKMEKDRIESKCSQTEQEYLRLESQLNEIVRQSNKEIELARVENDRTRSELEKQLIEAKQSLIDLRRRLAEFEGRAPQQKYASRSQHREDYFFSNESRIQTLERFQSSGANHYKGQSKTLSKLKEILRVLRDSLYRYDSLRIKKLVVGSPMSAEEELESTTNEIGVLVTSLLQLEQKSSRENQILHQKIEGYEKQRQDFEQEKPFEITLKEEAIKKLIQFVPSESIDLVSDYLYVVEKMAARCTNQHLQQKTELASQLTQQSYAYRDRYRQLEDTERRFVDLKLQHEQLRRVLAASQAKRNETELNKRDVKKKYFQH